MFLRSRRSDIEFNGFNKQRNENENQLFYIGYVLLRYVFLFRYVHHKSELLWKVIQLWNVQRFLLPDENVINCFG